MKIFRAAEIPSHGGDPKTFTGEVIRATIGGDNAGTPVNVYRVDFAPGARTHWHSHDGPQWLFVIEGRIRVQTLGGPATEAVAGDAVLIQPGEKHWHGAAAGERGVHLAVNVNAKTSWMEPVTDDEYGALG
ncbi:MAG TPA: cupin domain-containing protein [Vicinamibacterales bacterium]|nr:cupin domain-containing protein [Vicinamibacterales bacterium]